MSATPRLGRLRLEPPPRPEPSSWWPVLRVLFYAWLVGHMFVDFVSALRWFAE